jgi:hypothetical protein
MLSWLKDKIIPKYKPNEKEKLILDVVNNLCEHPDTDILMAPLSSRYYLINKKLEYWVRVYDNGITITNHKFTFSNTSPQMFQDMIVELIVHAIEKSRDEFETAVFQNELELLENIATSIKYTNKNESYNNSKNI